MHASILLLSLAALSGNGKLTTRKVEIPAFAKVHAKGSIDVVIREGAHRPAEVTIDDNLQSAVRVELDGDTLVVRLEDNVRRMDEHARVLLTTPKLKGASTSGSADLLI